jgi:hypothetical protein
MRIDIKGCGSVNAEGLAVGTVLFQDGHLTLHIVAEAYKPAEWVTADDLRQLAQYMDQIEEAMQ